VSYSEAPRSPAERGIIIMKQATGFPLVSLLISLLLAACGPSTDSALELLPEDSTYSTPAGSGGSYKDPIHQFFQAQVPRTWSINVRLDKTESGLAPDGPGEGGVVRRSWIQFRPGDAEIQAIAREAHSGIEEDPGFALQEFREQGARILSERSVTIDGVEGREVLLSIRDTWHLNLEYEKNGLEHSLTLSCPSGELLTQLENFVTFARSYTSLQPGTS
jgi:hypothetical protein